jgi:hypothetical protein
VTLNGLLMGDFPFVSMSTRKLDPMGLYPLRSLFLPMREERSIEARELSGPSNFEERFRFVTWSEYAAAFHLSLNKHM